MCGISGIFNLSNNTNHKQSQNVSNQMINTLLHRGPDGVSFFKDDYIDLAFCRLAINDASERGMQPMANEEDSVIFACNGEIYNYNKLKSKLVINNHIFKSQNDCEVIGHLFEDYGKDFLKEINGMFAIVLWDKRNKVLYLARDRVGMKPLYYSVVGSKLIFASEIKAILASGLYKKSVNHQTIDYFFTCGQTPLGETFFKNIKSVLPGEVLIIKNGRIKKEKYWNPEEIQTEPIGIKKAVNKLENILTDVIDMESKISVPNGLLLSGGVDSSLILALITKKLKRKITTFSLGFTDDKNNLINQDDFLNARKIAKHFNQKYIEKIVSFQVINDYYESFLDIFDEPVAFISPFYFICHNVNSDIRVLINGEGGDEVFCGYGDHLSAYNALGSKNFNYLRLFNENIYSFYHYPLFEQKEKNKMFRRRELKQGFGKNYYVNLINSFFKAHPGHDYINQRLLLDIAIFMPNFALASSDCLHMHNSIENRSPLLNYQLIEASLKLGGDIKIYKGAIKYVLKEIAKKYIPPKLMLNKKIGFVSPRFCWRKSIEGQRFINSIFSRSRIKKTGVFNYNFIDNFLKNRIGQTPLTALLTFQLWQEKHFC